MRNVWALILLMILLCAAAVAMVSAFWIFFLVPLGMCVVVPWLYVSSHIRLKRAANHQPPGLPTESMTRGGRYGRSNESS